MKKLRGKQLAQVIERECRKDLDKIEQRRGSVILGIPREFVGFMAIRAAEGYFDLFSEEIREAFRNRMWKATNASKRIENISNCNEVRAFAGMPEYLKPQTEWLRGYSKNLGGYLRKHGRADHDQALPIIVRSILSYRTRFNCWKELARVMRVAYIAAGRVADADHIKADTLRMALLRAAKRHCKGVTQ